MVSFFFLFFIIDFFTFTIRTNNTYSTLEYKKKKERVELH